MWLSGQQKHPPDCGEGQTGIVTMSGGETAVLLDRERRGLEVYAPGGYHWTPQVGQRVLVIKGPGEIPGIVGVRGGGGRPGNVRIEANALNLAGERVAIQASEGAIEAENVHLDGQVYVKEEKLEKLIERIVRLVLAGGSVK